MYFAWLSFLRSLRNRICFAILSCQMTTQTSPRMRSVEPLVLNYFAAFRELDLQNMVHNQALRNHGGRVMDLVRQVVTDLDSPDRHRQPPFSTNLKIHSTLWTNPDELLPFSTNRKIPSILLIGMNRRHFQPIGRYLPPFKLIRMNRSHFIPIGRYLQHFWTNRDEPLPFF